MKFLAFAAISVLGLAANQNSYTYQSEDFGLLEVAGVCSVTSEEVKCWDPQGKPSSKITELATAHFLVNSNNELRLRFRKKNRLIVMRTITKQNAKASFYGDLESNSGIRTSQAGNIGYESGQEAFKLYWYYALDTEASVDLTSYLQVQVSLAGTLSAKEGSETKLGAYTIKITGISEATANEAPYYGGAPGKTWKITYAISGPTEQEVPQVYVAALDAKNQPILYVDKDGNPTKPPKNPPMGGGFGPYPQQLVYPGGYVGSSNIGYWFSRIKPEKIGSLQVNGSTRRKITFKGIALEPTP
jgi:hypothetical protein